MSVSIRLGIAFVGLLTLAACSDPVPTRSRGGSDGGTGSVDTGSVDTRGCPAGYVRIAPGTFTMGSPDAE